MHSLSRMLLAFALSVVALGPPPGGSLARGEDWSHQLLASASGSTSSVWGRVSRLVSPAAAPPYTVRITNDLAYGPLPEEHLQLCEPAEVPGVHPVVVLIHSGSWR